MRPARPAAPAPRAARGVWLAASSAVLVCLSALLLFPSARAFAGGIIQHIGGFGFTHDPSLIVPVQKTGAGSVGVVKTHSSVSLQVNGKVPSAFDAAGASKLAGFTVLAPAYVPAGYSSMSDWFVSPQGSGMIATAGYRDAATHFLLITEWKAGNSPEQDYARDQIVDVTVRGQPGVYLPSPANTPGRKDALVWAENGITYSLISDSLPLDELMKVAEGLGK